MEDFRGADGMLLIGASENNADLHYASGFLAPDPYTFVQSAEASTILVSELEIDRAKAQAGVDRVLSIAPFQHQAAQQSPPLPAACLYFGAVALALSEIGLKRLLVPAEFPLAAADFLRAAGYELQVAEPPLFPQRAIKSPAELDAIQSALKAAEAGMEAAIAALRASSVEDDGLLRLEGETLTSEKIRYLIHHRLLELNCVAEHTIVACGRDSCDPHEEGSGPLRAHQPIVIDIFPRSAATRYFGDITRTVVKGRAGDSLKRMYETVLSAQERGLSLVCNQADGREIHREILALFEEAGFETGERDGRIQGFFHGTGHGLGLEIHESPSISSRGGRLETGHVVTVEPGLYYAGVGGVRIEDVVAVEDGGCRVLTSFPRFLEL
ncbi:MAG: Xaa-Pro peptidase family protein [Gemmatimonadetes bacterium]|nr:Xaa-Pro peptidase family protein [Gemmatimonadota bacterium]